MRISQAHGIDLSMVSWESSFWVEMTQETNGATGHVIIFFLWIKGLYPFFLGWTPS